MKQILVLVHLSYLEFDKNSFTYRKADEHVSTFFGSEFAAKHLMRDCVPVILVLSDGINKSFSVTFSPLWHATINISVLILSELIDFELELRLSKDRLKTENLEILS